MISNLLSDFRTELPTPSGWAQGLRGEGAGTSTASSASGGVSTASVYYDLFNRNDAQVPTKSPAGGYVPRRSPR